MPEIPGKRFSESPSEAPFAPPSDEKGSSPGASGILVVFIEFVIIIVIIEKIVVVRVVDIAARAGLILP